MMRQYYDKEWYAFWNLLQGTVDKIDKIQIEINVKVIQHSDHTSNVKIPKLKKD